MAVRGEKTDDIFNGILNAGDNEHDDKRGHLGER